jgi:hypothetical protein
MNASDLAARANSLEQALRQVSLILDPDGDGLKYTVTRSLNSDDCGALARLLSGVEVSEPKVEGHNEFEGDDSTRGGATVVYRMPKVH